MRRLVSGRSAINLRGSMSRTNGERVEVQYVCHCEGAPVCAVIAADGGREAANFSSGERRGLGGWRMVLMS